MRFPSRLVLASLPIVGGLALAACGGSPSSGAAAASPPAAPAAAEPTPTPGSQAAAAPANDAASPAPTPAPPPASAAVAPAPPPSPCPPGTILVKGGTFKIGPLKRQVTTVDVCMDQTEVTAATYEQCVKAGKCSDFQLKCAEAATYQVPGKESFPVVCVDFPQAKAVCEWRGMRLPTENEWEWAARGGEDNRKFAWGNDDPKDQTCWSGSSEGVRKGPCAVGSYAAGKSKDGLQDVTGNVFEWTSSSADGSDQMFVVRGGSWRDGVSTLLWNGRPGGFKPSYRCGFGGVRCVVEPGQGGDGPAPAAAPAAAPGPAPASGPAAAPAPPAR